MDDFEWDIFISHATEDKATVVRPLVDELRKGGVKVRVDEHVLSVGDSLSGKIDEGLSKSRFGAVVLSPAFFAKHWTKKELSGLRAKEVEGEKTILPIWHNVDRHTVMMFSSTLADAFAADTGNGIKS